MRRTLAISAALLLSASMVLIARIGIAEGDSPPTPSVLYADQGLQWTCEARKQFYAQDQGAQTIPYAWLKALAQPDGKPFLADSLTRYGYLRADIPTAPGLPIGFTLADSSSGPMAGMTCAACHTRQIAVSGQPIRIDGGPAFADFGRYLIDLDTATLAVLAKPDAFDAFATEVLGSGASEAAKAVLRADLTVWSTRYHLIVGQSLPTDQLWGAARLDAVSMILNRVTGLDVGGAPTYAIPENIVAAGAPTRYPFLWNASRQDHTQWPGFAPNGNDFFALSRNLGEVYGVFGLFHPELGTGSVATLFNRNYLVHNSGNFAGLQTLETLIKRIGPPAWQWPVDQTLAARGKTIYASVKTGPANKSCNDCHGITINYSIEHFGNWVTPVQNVGTDRAEWRVLARQVATGSLEGATIPFVSPVLLQRDLAINVLKISVAGALGEQGVSSVTRDMRATAPSGLVLRGTAPSVGATIEVVPTDPGATAVPTPVPSVVASQTASATTSQLNSLFRIPGMRVEGLADADTPAPFSYEARVMEGVWAAAPFLHNGSVPTLADLLKPAAQRPTSFAVGPAYDLETLGLATSQPGSSTTLHTTGCDSAGLMSGNSNCGHEYGTTLSDGDKKALLEYLKTL